MATTNLENNKELAIIHLKQVHRTIGKRYEDLHEIDRKAVVQSQYLIAKFILKYPKIPVFIEEEYASDAINASQGCKLIQEEVFSNGFPEDYNDLNEFQKEFLYRKGGPEILVCLQLIPKTYMPMDLETKNRIDLEWQKDLSQMFEPREKATIEHIGKLAKELNTDKVILVYGAGHDFSKEASKHDYLLIDIKFPVVTNYMNLLDKVHESHRAKAFGDKASDYKDSSHQLKTLIDWYPEGIKKILSSDYVSTHEIESLIKESFSKTYYIIKEDKLLDYIASGELPVNRIFDVYDGAYINDNLLCPSSIKESYNQEFLYLTNQDLLSINPFIDPEDLDLTISEILPIEIIGENYENLELNSL